MSIIYCPVCGKNIRYSNTCPRCGYEEKTDYEVYPTLDRIKSDLKSIEYRRRENENKRFESQFDQHTQALIIDLIEQKKALIALKSELEDLKKQNTIIEKEQEKEVQLKQPVIQSEEIKLQKNHVMGEIIYFGSYKQDSKDLEKKPIEWIVLEKKQDKLLMISKYALDCKPYNDELMNTTWEKCYLKRWLNSVFIADAFNSQEVKKIVGTNEKVFILSIQEVEKYFSSNEVRQCKSTKYAKIKNAFEDSKGNCIWWLRSSGYVSDSNAVVRSDGSIYYDGYDVRSSISAVRPAMWVNFEL